MWLTNKFVCEPLAFFVVFILGLEYIGKMFVYNDHLT